MYEIIANGINVTDRIVSLEFYDEIVSKEYIIGNSVSTEVKLKLINRDGLLQELKDHPFIINNKSYYIYNKPEKWDGTVDITLYDLMLRLNAVYISTLAYPTTVREQLNDISNQTKVVIDLSTLNDVVLDKAVDFYDTSTLMRDIVNDICQCDGKNALVINDSIKFVDLCTQTHQLDITANHTVIEEINYTRVLCDQGIKVLSAGTPEGNTIYLRSSNRYVAQEDIDRIYAKYKYLQFSSLSSLKCRDIPGISLTSLIEYDDMRFIPFYIKRTVYGGDAVDMLEIDGEVSTKEQESIVKEKDVGESIKKLEVNIDHNNQSIEIIAKEQEGIKTSVAELELSVDEISLKVEDTEESIYKFETGSNNIYKNCNQKIMKVTGEENVIYLNDMPLDINQDYMRGKDVAISVDVKSENGILKSLNGFCGAEFEVGYSDGTKQLCSTRFYAGQQTMQYTLSQGVVDIDKRIYCHYKLLDKKISSVSNLKIIIDMNGDKVVVSNPKVEFGTYPTGYQFDVPYVRDNVVTLQKDYTLIKQEVSSLSLQSVSIEEQITTIKGDVETVETRLQSTELKLTPTEITAMVNEKIGADGKLTTVKVTIDKNGLDVKNGAISITNNEGTRVLYADTNGNLVGNKITINNLQSTSGKIGKFNIDDKGFNYTEAVSISGKACTFTLDIHPDARDSFMNWKLKTNDGTADEIVGALTYSGIECNTVSATFVNAMELYADSINTTTLGVSDSAYIGYMNVTNNLRVNGTTNLYDVNISGHGYVNNSNGQAVSLQRIADLVR